MWRSKVISDGYEPGSTFKILTAAISMEEGLTEADRIRRVSLYWFDYYCR
ncbi:MAG: penicillin-binding transpeptidase domain-containing protein [Oscillospiraceae bacterium]|nr:penicillin-binding transpeptidase domain-containing protein [Oscillospiraceae bacterium]